MSNTAKATIYIMIGTIISKILGFGREIVLAYAYGTSMYSEIFNIAYSIPVTLFASLAIAIGTIFIPLYYEIDGKKEDTIKFTNNVFNIVFLFSIIIAILGIIFTEPLIKLMAMGFEGEKFKLTVQFTRVTIISIIFIFINNLIKPYLNMKGSFTIPALIGLPFNIIIIFFIILSMKVGPDILPYGIVIAVGSQLIFQLPEIYKKGYRYRLYVNPNDKNVKKLVWLLMPVLIGVGVNQVNTIIDRSLASTLMEGSISALNYANRLNSFVIGLFIASLGTVIYPMLSKLSTEKNDDFIDVISKSVNTIILLLIPISIGAIVLSTPIVKILFQRGAFNDRSTSMTATALTFYSIGMIGFGLRDILGKVFYSIQDTKTPMVNGVIAMGMNIILNLILVKFMGHAGLAFATSLSSIICIILLFNSLKKKVGYFGQDKILETTFKSLVSAIIMGIVSYFAYSMLGDILGIGFVQESIALFISIAIGVIIYGVLIIMLKVEEVNMITDMVKRKISA